MIVAKRAVSRPGATKAAAAPRAAPAKPAVCLTERQWAYMRWLRDFMRANGYAPTLHEIRDGMGVTTNAVFDVVRALERRGAISRGAKGQARVMKLLVDVPAARA